MLPRLRWPEPSDRAQGDGMELSKAPLMLKMSWDLPEDYSSRHREKMGLQRF